MGRKCSAGARLGRQWQRRAGVPFGALLMLWHMSAFAAQWQMHPSLQLSETYTDNVALDPPGNEKTEFVTQINPGVSLHGEGGHIRLDLNYRLQNLIYAGDASSNASHHQLAASGNAELVKDIFFVDARSSISQQIVNANGPVGIDNLNIGNQADVFTYGLSPYLKLRMASYANAELRYSVDRVENQSANISDAESQQYSLHMNSGPRFERLQWDADYRRQDMNLSTGEDSRYQSANADMRYHLLTAWNFLARGGQEDNTLQTVTDPHNGSYWSAGLEWMPSPRITASATTGYNNWDADLSLQPSERTSFHVGYRERDVGLVRGPSWNAALSHRTRRTTWQASYIEESTTVQALQLTGRQFFHLVDSQGNLIVDPNSGLPIVLVRNIFSLTDQEFIRKRGQFSVAMNTGKSDIVLSVFDERRSYSLSNTSEDAVGSTVSWTRQVSPRTHTVVGGGWQRTDLSGSDNHDDLWHGDLALVHRLSQDANASLEYSHMQRNSISANSDYDENRVTAQLDMRF